MAAKKPPRQDKKAPIAEFRSVAGPGQPEMFLHLPFVVTSGGAGVALKGGEIAAKGIKAAIDATTHDPLQFEIRGSWLDDAGNHRIDIRVVNSTKNGIYIEGIEIQRKYVDEEIDANRTSKPTVWPGPDREEPAVYSGGDKPLDYPLLLVPGKIGRLQLALPSTERKKMKSEAAVVKLKFADLGKEKSNEIDFTVRLRWHDL